MGSTPPILASALYLSIKFRFVTNEQARGNGGEEKIPETIWGRNLKRNQQIV